MSRVWRVGPTPTGLINRDFAKQFKILEHLSGTEDDGGKRIVGQRNRQAGLYTNLFIQVLEHRSAAGKYDAAIADVSAQLRRCPLQGCANGIDDGRHAFLECLAYFDVA